ncbi:MAG: ATP-binding protein [Tepidisphaerales bacterium]
MHQYSAHHVTGRLTRYACILAIGWTALAGGMLAWTLNSHGQADIENAKIQARTAFEKDVLFRRWNALRGGVYVAAGELTPPNPYLAAPNRDISLADGRRLTLVNPAYMTRQVHELQQKNSNIVGHITSLRPLNPGNAPDEWERRALQAFEQGAAECSGEEELGGRAHFRLMRPLIVEQPCLKCHAVQGYKEGDVRGGISVGIPMEPIRALTWHHRWQALIQYGGLWGVGMAGLLFAYRGLRRQIIQLATAREAADAASCAKSEFLANMSHEIRTPMTAILGFADLLPDSDQTPSGRADCIQTIRRNGQHLLTIINDTLDLSKIEAGKMMVERIACSPCQVAADVAALLRPRAAERGLSLDVDYAFPIPGTILSDPGRLRQILTNLVGNAVKFTERGGVKILLGLDRPAQAPPCLKFQVVDTGIGIQPDQIARLFQPFTQADSSTTRKFGGTGLGLTISRRLAQLLGGDLTAESTPGAGSRFVLTLPAETPADARMIQNAAQLLPSGRPQESQADLKLKARILLAEDGPDNQRLIAFHLRRAGAEVIIVENGELAIDHALDAQAAGTPFDIILMDMQMPVIDGYQATRTLRQRGYTRPIIALTAHAMTSAREECLVAGCDEYLSKPIDRSAMLMVLAGYLDGSRAESSSPVPQPVDSFAA